MNVSRRIAGYDSPNACAVRFIRTSRAKCLDWTLILGRIHLDRVLRAYAERYNCRRLHPGP